MEIDEVTKKLNAYDQLLKWEEIRNQVWAARRNFFVEIKSAR